MVSYSNQDEISLSVVIPVRNEEANIGNVLDQLSCQTLDPSRYEIIVVDGMSEDRTMEIVLASGHSQPEGYQ